MAVNVGLIHLGTWGLENCVPKKNTSENASIYGWFLGCGHKFGAKVRVLVKKRIIFPWHTLYL